MPRLKYKKKGKRVNLWIPDRQMKTAKEISNLSKFLQIALDQAADIMAYAILHKANPEKYTIKPMDDKTTAEFNKKFPQDELTQKRNGTWQEPSQKHQELW